MLEKTLESPLDCKEITPVNPKGNQSWIFIGRAGAEAEAPVLGPPDVKSWLIGKDPDAGKDWGQGEKGKTDDEMVGWHHWLNGREFEQILGDSEGQGSLVSCKLMESQGVGRDLATEQQLQKKQVECINPYKLSFKSWKLGLLTLYIWGCWRLHQGPNIAVYDTQ